MGSSSRYNESSSSAIRRNMEQFSFDQPSNNRTGRNRSDTRFRASMPVNMDMGMMDISGSSPRSARRVARQTTDKAFRSSTLSSSMGMGGLGVTKEEDDYFGTKSSKNKKDRPTTHRTSKPSGEFRRQVSAGSSTPMYTVEEIPRESPKKSFRKILKHLGLPEGLLASTVKVYEATDSRLWILDNSYSMRAKDAHLISGSMDHLLNVDSVSRWKELGECVAFHAKMAADVWCPTKFWLLNDPKSKYDDDDGAKQKFCVCWSTPRDIPNEMAVVKQSMKEATPTMGYAPLSYHMQKLKRAIDKVSHRLVSEGKHTTIVVCTQGIPTDVDGNTGKHVLKEYKQTVASFAKMPVKIIFRLCTDDVRVLDMYNNFDNNLDGIDCIDDYWAEAMEVYLHNPWLTYGVGLHRLREAGFAPEIMDDLDERHFSLDDIHKFCETMFIGEHGYGVDLPHPRNWDTFFHALQSLVEKEQLQWNPIKKKLMPWINLEKLKSTHGPMPKPRQQLKQRYTQASSNGADPPPEQECHSPPHQRQRVDLPTPKDLTLAQVLQQWSNINDKKLHPLGQLLITVPDLFPPTNTKVEDHEYFKKWKVIDRDAFDGDEDEVKDLLKRAVRKTKFFLHPDKLPKDLTEDQTLLLKTIWNVVQESELKTLG